MNFFVVTVCFMISVVLGATGCQQGCLDLRKTYDENANGYDDPGEPSIDWVFRVTSVLTTQQAYYSAPATLYLPFGTYTVCDVPTKETNWWQTGRPDCQNYTLLDSDCVVIESTSLCTHLSVAQAGGYWTGHEGQALLSDEDLAALAALHLVKADGSAFDPSDKTQLKEWLGEANPEDMPYWLSVQLAVSTLNTRHMVNSSTYVKAPFTTTELRGGMKFTLLADVQQDADKLLAAADVNYDAQALVAAVLNETNFNQNYAQAVPCPHTFASDKSSDDLSGLEPPCGGTNPPLSAGDGISGQGSRAVSSPTESIFRELSATRSLGAAVKVSVVGVSTLLAILLLLHNVRKAQLPTKDVAGDHCA